MCNITWQQSFRRERDLSVVRFEVQKHTANNSGLNRWRRKLSWSSDSVKEALCELKQVTPGLLSIMPKRPVRDKWDYSRKMKRHFPIKPRQPIGIALATFYHLMGSWAAFHYGKDSGNFGRNSNGKVRFGFFRPEYSGSPLEVVHLFRLEYSDRDSPFHFWQTGSLP